MGPGELTWYFDWSGGVGVGPGGRGGGGWEGAGPRGTQPLQIIQIINLFPVSLNCFYCIFLLVKDVHGKDFSGHKLDRWILNGVLIIFWDNFLVKIFSSSEL